MAVHQDHHDVAIVGASIAGCTAAILFGRAGLRVALVERSPDPETDKRVRASASGLPSGRRARRACWTASRRARSDRSRRARSRTVRQVPLFPRSGCVTQQCRGERAPGPTLQRLQIG